MKIKNWLPLLSPLFLAAGVAEASWYPPGYGVERSCQTQGAVEVCAINQHYGNYPRIEVRYQGSLDSKSGVNVWISFNGKSGFYTLNDGLVALNDPRPYMCVVGGLPEGTEGPYGECLYPEQHTEPKGTVTWEVTPIASEESQLFFYARNQFGVANAWDLELAFVDKQGNWDSAYGQNYRYRFL